MPYKYLLKFKEITVNLILGKRKKLVYFNVMVHKNTVFVSKSMVII